MDGFLEHLNLDLKRYGQRYIGPCPVHGGDYRSGVNLYADGFSARGNWQCYGNKCEKYFRPSLIGFTRGVMSHEQYGWSQDGDRRVTFKSAVDEICKFLKVDFADITVDPAKAERRRFNKTVEILSPTGRPINELCSVEVYHRHHNIPSGYYLNRKVGFTASTLKKFEVGECTYRHSPNLGRISVPVYDTKGEIIIGLLSRSPHDRCKGCKTCHDSSTPCSKDFNSNDLRWKVVPDGFNDKHHLYNLWRSRPMIIKSKCIVLVEGCGDVWRLDEAGILNAVGMNGSKLSTIQDIMVEECSPTHMVVLTDDNDAGNACAEAITRKWSRLSHVHRLKPIGATEVSDMTTDDVRSSFRGLIEGWMK